LVFILYKQFILRKSVKEFDEIINATMEGISIFKNNICIDVNQSGVDILGYSSKVEIIGKNILSFVPDEYTHIAKEKLMKDDTLPYEFNILKKDNTSIPVLIRGHYMYCRYLFIKTTRGTTPSTSKTCFYG
jgi:two-component system sporulation sensor kinase A